LLDDLFSDSTIKEIYAHNSRVAGVKFGGELNLSKALFYSSNLRDVSFIDAQFNNADFSSSELSNVTFNGVSLRNSDFEEVKVTSKTIFTGSTLNNVNFKNSRVNFTKLGFSNNSIQRNKDFVRESVNELVFDNCELDQVDFSGIELHGSRLVFMDSKLKNVTVNGVKIQPKTYSKNEKVVYTVQPEIVINNSILNSVTPNNIAMLPYVRVEND
jgi:uncharacterized protein YjbI with pentapeptide repeats